MKIILNNKFVSENKATVSITSESFMYGFGVFETLRTYCDLDKTKIMVFKAKEHIDRLFCSAEMIGLKIDYSKDEIIGMLNKLISSADCIDQRIKITAFKKGLSLTSTPLSVDNSVYSGVSLKTVECDRYMPKAKTISYLSSYLSHKKATDLGYFEALLVDKNNQITEGAYSNIFWFEGDILCTRKDGVLEGITRQTVLDISPFEVRYSDITVEELINKTDIFITQTTTGVVPVTKIDDRKISEEGKIGENTKKIMSCFEKYIKEYTEHQQKNRVKEDYAGTV